VTCGPAWLGEPVVRIGPRRSLRRILARRRDARGELAQPEAATFADRSERLAFAPEVKGELVGHTKSVITRHCGDRQNGSINAA
jgi:hypothetical protein